MSASINWRAAAPGARAMIGRAVADMRNPPTRPKPFLDAARRDWQFDDVRMAAAQLRRLPEVPRDDAGVAHRGALSRPRHERARGRHGACSAASAITRAWPSGPAPWSRKREQPRTIPATPIGFRSSRTGPMRSSRCRWSATFAHELARYLVETFEEPAPGGDALLEPAVDIAAVFMGFGLFMANSAVRNPGLPSERRRVRACAGDVLPAAQGDRANPSTGI